jgi:WD40 repeat protein
VRSWTGFQKTIADRLGNAATGEQTQKLEGHDDWVIAVAFSPDRQVVGSASDDRTPWLWNATTGEQLHAFQSDIVSKLAFSQDG